MSNYLARQRTPTSPSPSPEPAGGAEGLEGGAGRAGADGSAAGSTTSAAPPPSTTLTDLTSQGTSTGHGGGGGGGGGGAIGADGSTIAPSSTSSAVLANAALQDESEIARQVLEEKIRIGVDDLMQLAMCAGGVQPGDEEIVRMKINEAMESLQAIQDATNLPKLTQMVPEDVMGMIDQGRNPDIHTRTFTNRLTGDNQQMRGQANNFDRYRARLRAKIESAFPEMKDDLEAMDAIS